MRIIILRFVDFSRNSYVIETHVSSLKTQLEPFTIQYGNIYIYKCIIFKFTELWH